MRISIDCESHCFLPVGKVRTIFDVPKLVCVQIARDDGTAEVIHADDPGALAATRCALEAATVYGHNISFDLGVLVKEWPELRDVCLAALRERRILDTRALYKLRYPPVDRPATLAGAVYHVLGKRLGKGEVRTSFRRDVPLTEDQIWYAREDAVWTLKLGVALEAMPLGALAHPEGREHRVAPSHPTYNGDAPDALYSTAAAYMAFYLQPVGLSVNQESVEVEHTKLADDVERLSFQLYEAGLMSAVRRPKSREIHWGDTEPAGLRQLTRKWKWDPGAMKLVRETPDGWVWVPADWKLNLGVVRERLVAIAKEHNLTPPISAKTNALSMEYDYWREYKALLDEPLQLYLELTKARKYLSSFTGPLHEVSAKHVYPSYYIPGAVTGRWACSKNNLQQQPKRLRHMYNGRTYGADFAALEAWTLSHCMEAFGIVGPLKKMLREEDMHQHVAGTLGVERQEAKACFHPDVEVLTQTGWCKVSALTGNEKVANWWPDKTVDFRTPLRLTTRADKEVFRVHDKCMDVRVTADHRMVGASASKHHDHEVCLPSEMNTRLRHTWGAANLRPGQSTWSKVKWAEFRELDVRRAVAVQADGSFTSRGATTLAFRKERKIARCRRWWPTVEPRVYGPVTSFRVPNGKWRELLTETKSFRWELACAPERIRKWFLDELPHWDGHVSAARPRLVRWSSTDTQSVDVVQAVATLTGRKSRATWSNPPQANWNPCATVSIKDRSESRTGSIQMDSLGKMRVYCLSSHSSFIVVRDGGAPFISPQCTYGLGGGMGERRFFSYLRYQCGLQVDYARSCELRRKWLGHFWDVAQYLNLFRFDTYTMCPPHRRLKEWCLDDLGFEEVPSRWDLGRKLGGRICVTLPSGRVIPGRTFSQAANTYFQGTGADVMTQSFVHMCDAGIQTCAIVHDAAYSNDENPELVRCMQRGLQDVCPTVADFAPLPELECKETFF